MCSNLFSSLRRFQFHKGTIETDLGQQPTYLYELFQFHKGTIETVSDVDVTSDICMGLSIDPRYVLELLSIGRTPNLAATCSA